MSTSTPASLPRLPRLSQPLAGARHDGPMAGRIFEAAPGGDVLPPLPVLIDFLGATDPDTWWEGPTFRSSCGTRHCVLAHIESQWGMRGFDEFEALYSTSYVIGAAVNDRPSAKYHQEHPRDRVVAFLRAMLQGNADSGGEDTTLESMEKHAALDLAATC